MVDGRMVMIHDAHFNEKENSPLSVAEYFILLMFSTQGRCYSVEELKITLTTIGFKNIDYRKTVGKRSIITGVK